MNCPSISDLAPIAAKTLHDMLGHACEVCGVGEYFKKWYSLSEEDRQAKISAVLSALKRYPDSEDKEWDSDLDGVYPSDIRFRAAAKKIIGIFWMASVFGQEYEDDHELCSEILVPTLESILEGKDA